MARVHIRSPLATGRLAAATLSVGFAVSVARAQPDPSGIDFVTIGDPGNAPYSGAIALIHRNRGGVAYEYRIGQTEVTTAQWVEFFNAAMARPDPLPLDMPTPIFWGAISDPAYSGPGRRFLVGGAPNAGSRAVSGVTWRQCAAFANWLHNDKRSDLSAFMDGAYDLTTFGVTPEGIFTDQRQHHPGARYWIPTLDEWVKAAYYDPQRHGQNQGGWWQQPNGTDTPLTYGVPGVGQANAGFRLPGNAQYQIPLGAYPQTRSPWGLLDLAGGTEEWLESFSVDPNDGTLYRMVKGSSWTGSEPWYHDRIAGLTSAFPAESFSTLGFRVAGVIPSPSANASLVVAVILQVSRRRRACFEMKKPASAIGG